MNLYIGKQQQSGDIAYISVSWAPFYNDVPRILKTFYSKIERVDALIALGNMWYIGPSPYGKYDYGLNIDSIHCRAEIRDEKKSKGSRLPRYGSEAEFLKLEGHLFLFKEGKWHYHYAEGFSASLPQTLPVISTKPLEGLEFYYLDEKGEISYLYGKDYKSWDNIAAQSESKKSPIFVFRNNKLIKTINHPLNQQ